MELYYVIAYVLVQMIPATILSTLPFKKLLRVNSVVVVVGLVATYTFVGFGSMWFMTKFEDERFRIFFSIFCIITVWVIYSYGYSLSKFQTLFIALLVKNYVDAVVLFAKSFTEFHCRNYTFIEQYSAKFHDGFYLMAQMSAIALTFPIMWMFMKKLIIPLIQTKVADYNFWRYLWIIPASFYFTYRLGIAPGYSGGEIIWSNNYLFLPYAWAIGTFFTYVIIAYVLLQTVNSTKLAERLHISKIQMQMQAEQYKTLRQNIEQTKLQRHDLRHHLLAIKGYADANDCAGIEEYLDTYLSSINTEEPLNICENYAINSIIAHYFALANSNNITATASVTLPDPLSVVESDLCIVLGNLIENAYEACAAHTNPDVGGKFIAVKIGISGAQMIAISVKNSYSGEVKVHDNLFISSKADREGIGTASVRSIAEKYNGICNFNYENGVFHVTVLLNP